MHIRRDVPVGTVLYFRDDTKPSDSPTSGNDSKSGSMPSSEAAIIIGAVVGAFCVLGFSWLVYRKWRQRSTAKYSRSGRDDNDHTETADGPATAETTMLGSSAQPANQDSTTTVDRNISVRSVMTLPPYRHQPLENESVLGREGERDGIDVVVEMPTIEDEELLREEEMDALYQIRLARRRQIEEQQARRVARREARARNDQAALSEIRAQTRAASTNNSQEIAILREEHNRARETRTRAVSSVSYADIGVARHDGTRIRANSSESERVGLLSDISNIAAVGGNSQSSTAQQRRYPPQASMHHRGRSGSSALSIVTTRSSEEHQQQLQLQSTHTTTRSRASSLGHDRAGSSPELIDASEAAGFVDGENAPPTQSPPSYDEVSLNDLTPAVSHAESPYFEPPPDYTPGPSETRDRRLSGQHVPMDDVSSSTVIVPPAAVAAPAATRETATTGDTNSRRLSRSDSVVPQLPSLRLAQLPQIVVEPSNAALRDTQR